MSTLWTMGAKTKTFDCVEIKNRIQAERMAEYQARKDKVASYIDFVNARVKDSELAKIVSAKNLSAKSAAARG